MTLDDVDSLFRSFGFVERFIHTDYDGRETTTRKKNRAAYEWGLGLHHWAFPSDEDTFKQSIPVQTTAYVALNAFNHHMQIGTHYVHQKRHVGGHEQNLVSLDQVAHELHSALVLRMTESIEELVRLSDPRVTRFPELFKAVARPKIYSAREPPHIRFRVVEHDSSVRVLADELLDHGIPF